VYSSTALGSQNPLVLYTLLPLAGPHLVTAYVFYTLMPLEGSILRSHLFVLHLVPTRVVLRLLLLLCVMHVSIRRNETSENILFILACFITSGPTFAVNALFHPQFHMSNIFAKLYFLITLSI